LLSVAVGSGLRHGDRDCGGGHVVAEIALELTDAGAFHLAAIGGWDAVADVNHDYRITSLDAPRILRTAAETWI